MPVPNKKASHLIRRIKRKAMTLNCNWRCFQQTDPLASYPKMIVTTFYDVEGDYAMPGQNAASVEAVGKILEIEHKYNIRSTYNVVGKYALDHPDIIRSIAEAGNELASHSFDHSVLNSLSAEGADKNIELARECFKELGFHIEGHRSPQSEWNYNVARSLFARQYSWNAENGDQPHPFRLLGKGSKSLWRFPIVDDDWCYERERLSPVSAIERWTSILTELKGRQKYAAIGFHPWVEAPRERMSVLQEFFHWLSEQKDIQVMPFGDVLRMIQSDDQRPVTAANES